MHDYSSTYIYICIYLNANVKQYASTAQKAGLRVRYARYSLRRSETIQPHILINPVNPGNMATPQTLGGMSGIIRTIVLIKRRCSNNSPALYDQTYHSSLAASQRQIKKICFKF